MLKGRDIFLWELLNNPSSLARIHLEQTRLIDGAGESADVMRDRSAFVQADCRFIIASGARGLTLVVADPPVLAAPVGRRRSQQPEYGPGGLRGNIFRCRSRWISAGHGTSDPLRACREAWACDLAFVPEG